MMPSGFYFDPQTLAGLRGHNDQRQTLERVAQQFEALFVHMLLKQMREASFGDGLFDSSQSTFYRDMFDAQMAQHVGGEAGLGIAELLVRELGKTLSQTPAPEQPAAGASTSGQPTRARAAAQDPAAATAPSYLRALPQLALAQAAVVDAAEPTLPSSVAPPTADWFASAVPPTALMALSSTPVEPAPAAAAHDWRSPQEFLAHLQPFARKAAQQLGVASDVLLAQATLETGWGRQMPRHPDGRNSFNLFGIKADARWSGDWVSKPTLEFRGGAMRQERAQFRAYASAHDSFKDYAYFLTSNPRYAGALAVAGDPSAYLHALQNAGYATDPHYAQKILSLVDSERFRNALPPETVKESSDDAV